MGQGKGGDQDQEIETFLALKVKRKNEMIGIVSVGAYIPAYRLTGTEIGRAWRTNAKAGEKAVAGYDEDAVTLAVASALDCMGRSNGVPNALYFASTTCPYREKQGAAIIASAVDLENPCHTADFADSLRSATIALHSALTAVKSGSAEQVMVTSSDCRLGAPKGRMEQILGDGAASIMIGKDHVIAEVEGSFSIFSNFTDLWRRDTDPFVQSGESRFTEEMGFMPIMQEAITQTMKRASLAPGDFSKAVFYAKDSGQHARLAKSLGFEKVQVQDPLFSCIGNTGTPAALIMLVAALEEARPDDRILFAGYGDGSDVFVLRVTDQISSIKVKPMMPERIGRRISIDYGSYLDWRNLLALEGSSLYERPEPSIARTWRERKTVSALYGQKCNHCGTPQIHPLGQQVKVCVVCGRKDDFEDYKFSDKTGRLFTYAVDQLQPTKNPPGLNGVVDFDGGGRLVCEMTDFELDKVFTGMRVDMTFRRFSDEKGIINYFWKAKPLSDQPPNTRKGQSYGEHKG